MNVQYLFAVPRIRTSIYIETLSQAFPQIRSQPPGEIQIEELPELRNLVVVDNAEEEREHLGRLKIKSLIDWREILLWREDASEERKVNKLKSGLKKDDVINLQFTRLACYLLRIGLLLIMMLQRDNRTSQSRFRTFQGSVTRMIINNHPVNA